MSERSIAKPGQAALSKPVKEVGVGALHQLLKSRENALAKAADKALDPSRLITVALGIVDKTPRLADCTIGSIFVSLLEAAESGLELGFSRPGGYLVPYGNRCQFQPSYYGLIDLASRHESVSHIEARAVFAGDSFEYEYGLEPVCRHKPCGVTDANKLTHAYAVIVLSNGNRQFDVMTREEIEFIRNGSRAKDSGPWVTNFVEMARKTVVRRALKYAPMSRKLQRALAVDDAVDTGDYSKLEIEFGQDELTAEFNPPQAEEQRRNGVDAVKEKLGVKDASEEPLPEDPAAGPGQEETAELRQRCKNLLEVLYTSDALRNTVTKKSLGDTPIDEANHDQLLVLSEALSAEAAKKGKG